MFALSTWSSPGRRRRRCSAPSNDCVQQRVVVLEVARRGVEADRRGGQVVVELVDQEEGLRWPTACGWSASSSGRRPDPTPQSGVGRQRGAPLTVNGVKSKLEVAALGRDLLRRLRDVVVVDVRPRVRVRAGQVGRGRGQPARRGEVLAAERAAVRGAEVVVEDVPGEALDAVGAPQEAAGGRVDDAVVVLARRRLVVDAPGQPRAAGGAEQRQPRLLAAREARSCGGRRSGRS